MRQQPAQTDMKGQATDFPWYDSPWLKAYAEARMIVAEVAPGRLEEFTEAMRVFTVAPDFQVPVAQDVLAPGQLARVREIIADIPQSELEDHEFFRFGRFVLHDHPEFTAMQRALTDRVSELAGEQLEPSYNFLSLYNNFGVCRVHMDAPVAKWTLDICIEQSAPWPILFSQPVPWPIDFERKGDDWHRQIVNDPALHFSSHTLGENQALLFSGANQWHYRDRIPRLQEENFCHLLFMHYVPAGCDDLLNPNNWHACFSIPELRAVDYQWQREAPVPA